VWNFNQSFGFFLFFIFYFLSFFFFKPKPNWNQNPYGFFFKELEEDPGFWGGKKKKEKNLNQWLTQS